MSKDKKNYMPQSGAGLMRFSDDDKSLIRIKPEHVVIISSAIGLGLLMLKFV